MGDDGGIQNLLTVRAKFHRLIVKANLRPMTFHDLRRMHARMLINAGVPLIAVKDRLGHKSVETTIKQFYAPIS